MDCEVELLVEDAMEEFLRAAKDVREGDSNSLE